jgi:hypothetical protein
MMGKGLVLALAAMACVPPLKGPAQSVDWQSDIYHEPQVRYLLADMQLGGSLDQYHGYATQERDPDSREAIRLWDAGVRILNATAFERKWVANEHGEGRHRRVVFRGTDRAVDGSWVKLNSDPAYGERNVRYFMADIALGGSIEFYRHAAEAVHEMGCLEAVRRTEEGYTITNLDQFERKQVNGQTLITRKGGEERISGLAVRLSSDAE